MTTIGSSAFSNCSQLETVHCYADTPPVLVDGVFSIHKTLYVPEGTKELYANAVEWEEFEIIIDDLDADGAASVEGVTAGQELPKTYYQLDGVKVAADAAGLPSGIYIVRQGDASKKILVK